MACSIRVDSLSSVDRGGGYCQRVVIILPVSVGRGRAKLYVQLTRLVALEIEEVLKGVS